MEKKDIFSRIAGVLKYGHFNGKKSKKRTFVELGVLIGVCVSAFVLMVILILLDYQENPTQTDGTKIFIVLSATFLGIMVLPTYMFIIVLKNEKIRKDISLWLDDAVEIRAYSKKIDVWSPIIFYSSVKIQVKFEIGGKQMSHFSKSKMIGGGVPSGYHSVWTKYADKTINILYSPKYDEVIVLKD